MSRESWRLLLIVTLLAAAGGWLFLHYFERGAHSIDFGYSPAARRNDYLAAQRFLTGMDIPSSALSSPTAHTKLPPAGDVLLLLTKRLTIDNGTQQALLDWVRSGGHLIISARTDTVTDGIGDLFDKVNEVSVSNDPLFEALDISLERLEMDDGQLDEYGPFGVDFANAADFVWVDFDPQLRLLNNNPELHALAGDDLGDVILSGAIGDGHISIIADRKPLHNRRIGQHQHALFLWHLVNLYSAPGGAHIVNEDDMPALPAWLWNHARELVISLLLGLLLTLATVTRRFGPLRADPAPVRRSIVEHIRASGDFLWRHHYHGELLQGIQQDIRREMSLKHPLTQGMDPARAARHLADLVELPEDDIRRALSPPNSPDARLFTHNVRVLSRLREQL